MAVLTFKPNSVCCREMTIEYEKGIVIHAEFAGGCKGNLQAIGRLIEGMEVADVVKRLEGIKCPGSRGGLTSCPDQLAKALQNNNL